MTAKFKAILLFGAPGVGKGTQGKMLGSKSGFHHLACGDVFRALDKSSELGKRVLTYSSKGELVPDDLTVEMWKDNMQSRIKKGDFKPGEQLLVLDGIPRNTVQAKELEPHVEVLGVVHLVCKNVDEMVQRMRGRALKENRPDDADEKVIRRRFEVYDRETAPVLAHYAKSLVHDVDAVGAPDLILQRILEIVAPMRDKHFNKPLASDRKS